MDVGDLVVVYFDVLMYMYLVENVGEIVVVGEWFFDVVDYLDVYDWFGLVGLWLVFVYCVYMSDWVMVWMCVVGSGIVFCLILNLFFGLGLFDLV